MSTFHVLTVCTGNICRSPMAEVVLRDRFDAAGLGAHVLVASAGVSDEEVGRPMDRRARAVLAANGYPAPEHRAREVSPEDLTRSDLVLAMTAHHARVLRRIAAADVARRVAMYRAFDPAAPLDAAEAELDVADPWYGEHGDFVECLQVIEAAADGIVDHVRERLDVVSGA